MMTAEAYVTSKARQRAVIHVTENIILSVDARGLVFEVASAAGVTVGAPLVDT